ncbi:class I tRNA ligase family protein [Patescibacteria group bacterium]|nr:class I tRNA ligase family protein [Patescibacteria group bacterium]
MRSSRALGGFLDDLTNWYIRRSRRRFWKEESDQDKKDAYATLYYALVNFCQVAAPFMPFITEYIYKVLTKAESVHLTNWPEAHLQASDKALLEKTKQAQDIISIVLAARSRKNIRVRQPLQLITIGVEVDSYFNDIISDECNAKEVKIDTSINSLVTKICKPDGKYVGETFGSKTKEIFASAKSGDFKENADASITVAGEILPAGTYEISYVKSDAAQDIDVDNGIVVKVDWSITPELELEGYARDLVRFIQDGRKEADYHLADRIKLSITGDHLAVSLNEQFKEYIQDETLSTLVELIEKPDLSKEVELDGQTIIFSIKR